MLIVVEPAAASNLTTLMRAREMLDFAPEEEATVSMLIEQASQAIADYCRRPFGIETVRQTFYLPQDEVVLSRSPVLSFVEVRSGDDVLEPDEYQHHPVLNALWPHTSDGGSWEWARATPLTVTYTAGYVLPSDEPGAPEPTLPATVERAAIRLVGTYMSLRGRDPAIKSETTEGIGSTSWWAPSTVSGLADGEAALLLTPYRVFF